MDGLDGLDIRILDLLLLGNKSKDIATQTDRPLSTVQRRIRRLFEEGAVTTITELNYKKLGLKHGEIFVYLKNGDVRKIAEELAAMDGMLSVSIHIGNSDIVGAFMYRDSTHLLELTSRVRQIQGVDRIVWSEEIYSLPVKTAKSLAPVIKWQHRAKD
jgi:DNA-binding Lrp family transcriptional regulator